MRKKYKNVIILSIIIVLIIAIFVLCNSKFNSKKWYKEQEYITLNGDYSILIFGNYHDLDGKIMDVKILLTDLSNGGTREITYDYCMFSYKEENEWFEFEELNDDKIRLTIHEINKSTEVIFIWSEIFA